MVTNLIILLVLEQFAVIGLPLLGHKCETTEWLGVKSVLEGVNKESGVYLSTQTRNPKIYLSTQLRNSRFLISG